MSFRWPAILHIGVLLGLVIFGLAYWQFDWLNADPRALINHGHNEDWDWQLSLYEVTRKGVMEFGELPVWNPYTQGGVPLLANPEYPLFYPPFALILVFGTSFGIKLWILFHFALLIVGGWVAGREIGLSRTAAHLGSLFVLCSAFLPGFVQYGHIMFLPVGWLPLAWVAARRGWWQWSAACLALSFFAGGHYLLLYGALWLGLDALFRGFSREGVRWLAVPLAVNAVFLGVAWLKWLVLCGVVAALYRWRPVRLKHRVLELSAIAVLAALLIGVKLTTAPVLFERAERLEAQNQTTVADTCPSDTACYGSFGESLAVMSGDAERLSGHEGQNVFWSPWPVLIGLAGLVLAAFMRPAWGLIGLVFWCVGWGGVTPLNLLEGLHRIPGFDHIRVVERYSLIWTMFLGWGAGYLLDTAFHKGRRWAALPVAVLLGIWVFKAAPQAKELMSFVGPHRQTPEALDSHRFEQLISEEPEKCRRGEGSPSDWFCSIAFSGPGAASEASNHTNYESIRRGKGRLDCWTTAWLGDPSPALRAKGLVGYHGEAWVTADHERHVAAARFTTREIRIDAPMAGELTVNQNAVRGWKKAGGQVRSKDGLINTHIDGGPERLVYEPPGLLLGTVLSTTGLVILVVYGRRRGFAFRSNENAPRR